MVDSPFLDLLVFAVLTEARQEGLAANSTEYLLTQALVIPWSIDKRLPAGLLQEAEQFVDFRQREKQTLPKFGLPGFRSGRRWPRRGPFQGVMNCR